MYKKIQKILFLFLFVFLAACNSGSPAPLISNATYPSLFLDLEASNIAGTLKVYDAEGKLSSETDLIISNDLVTSEAISLESQLYNFVLSFYYTLDDGNLVGIANVVLDETLLDGDTQLSYEETDIVYDNPPEINNDLSASFSLGFYEVTNLDLDGDGVSNIREILANSNPLDASDIPDSLSINLTEGQIVQDTVTIIAQYFPSDEAQALFIKSPSGFEDQNSLADIFLTSWVTTEYAEDEAVKLSFLAQNISGELIEKTLTVLVDNYPNVTLEAATLIQNDESVTLSWDIGNYTEAEIDQQIGSLTEASGSVTLNPTLTTTYTLTATRKNTDGESFTTQKSVTVVVNDVPVFLGSTTNSLGQNPSDEDGATFSWQSSDANSDTLTSTVSVYENEGCLSDAVAEQSTTSSTLNMSGLLPRMTYSWRVVMTDGKSDDVSSECFSFTTGDEDLIAWWPMDEGAGNILSDLSGNELDWTLSGSSSKPAWDSGVSGTGLHFDGVNDVSTLPAGITTNAVADLSKSVSFDFWAYIDPDDENLSGNYSYLITNIGSELDVLGSGGYGIFYEDRSGEHTIKFYGVTPDKTYFEAAANEVILVADWYHVTATYDATAGGLAEARLYINGDLSGSDNFDDVIKTTSSLFTVADVSQPLTPVNFSGVMDELAIYTRALGAGEVREFCTRMGTGNCAASDLPVLISPAPSDALSPTEVFFSWEPGKIPDGLSVDHYVFCYTTGSESALDDEDECANRTSVYDATSVVELDPSITSTQTYYWKVKSCYDASCSQSSLYSQLSYFFVYDSVQGRWQLDEGSGTLADNEEGSPSYDATLYGSPNWESGGVTDTDQGSSVILDGVNDYLNVSSSIMSDPGLGLAMSFEIWAYMDPSVLDGGHAYLMTNSNEDILGAYGLLFDDRSGGGNNTIKFFGSNGADYFELKPDEAVTEEGWYHIVGTYDYNSSEARLYINGELLDTAAYHSTVWFPGYGLTMGTVYSSLAGGYTRYFSGSLDNAAVYKKALSDVEVLNNYCAVIFQSGNTSELCK